MKPNTRFKFLASAALTLAGATLWGTPAIATPQLTITPITFDMVGLDSNRVTDGPNKYLSGVRVCNIGTSTANNVKTTFFKDGAINPYINLEPGTSSVISIPSLPAGPTPPSPYTINYTPSNCSDFYYNIVVTRNAAAYNTFQRYYIEATADSLGVVRSPTPRQLYVQKILSQARNEVTSFTGPSTVVVGQTYEFTVQGKTATAYPQLVFSPDLPNNIFQVIGARTSYSNPTGAVNSIIYADACGWVADPTSTNYNKTSNTNCSLPDNYGSGDAGGNVTTTYTIKVLGGAGQNVAFTNLIYDFSGGSYHYNADYGTGINIRTLSVVAPPDLTITKNHTGTFTQGSTGTYTLTATNSGGSATSGLVTVSDTLPAGLTPTAASGTGWTCSISGSAVTCTRSDALPAGGSYPPITLTVAIALNAPASVINTGTVSGGGQTNTTNDNGSVTTPINGVPDLTLTKTATGTFSQGSTGTYTLTATNAGGAATTGLVTVSDPLPTELTPIAASGTGWNCSISGSTVTCTRSDALPAGGSYPPITLTAAVASNAPASVINIGTVSGGGQTNTTNDNGNVTTSINGVPDLTLTKTATGTFSQGSTGTYTLTATNAGRAATTGLVTVSDPLPTGLTPTAASGTGWNCSISGSTVTCTRSDALPAGGSYPPITLTAAVASNAPASVINIGTVSGGGQTNTTNDNGNVTTSINGVPDLTLTKIHTGNFTQGSTGTYTLTATNAGRAATTGLVTVSDTLPAGLTPTAASGTNWNCSISGSTVTCTRSDALPAGGSYPPITLTAAVASNAPASVINIGTVSGGGQTNTTNDNGNVTTSINGVPDLTLTKIHTGNFTQGSTGTYTLTATNAGRAATTGLVTVSDTLPAGLTPTAASGTNWNCSISGSTVTCTRSDALPAGGSYPPITLTAAVASNAPASVINIGTVSGGGQTNTTNDSGSDPTTINGVPDLTITKTPTGNFIRGATGTYTIVATNSGSASTTGTVTVNDTLPVGLTLNGTPSGPGWTCTTTSTTAFSCTRSEALSPGASYPAIAVNVLVAQTAANSVINTATVAGGGENNTTNNSAIAPTNIISVADLSITKTDGQTSVTAGTPNTYTITVTNNGPSNVTGATVTDPVPSSITGVSWSCTNSGGASCGSGTGNNLNTTVNLAAGSTVTYTVNGTVATTATGTISNTATVAVPNGVSDPNTTNNTATDTTAIAASLPPNLLLVKRITRINDTDITGFVDGPGEADNHPHWPTPTSTSLRGAINGGLVKPGDVVEYTIYFLNTNNSAQNVTMCDLVPKNTTFVPNAFNSVALALGGSSEVDRGISALIAGNSAAYSNIEDGDTGRFYPAETLVPAPQPCAAANTTANGAGAIVIQLGNMPNATAAGSPANAYGYVRFRVKVD